MSKARKEIGIIKKLNNVFQEIIDELFKNPL